MRAGFVTVLGRPNVGKSTLINKIVGSKVSITSQRAQTTRHRILGIKTSSDAQIVLVDTPGLHKKITKTLNKVINKTARDSVEGVDLILMVISAKGWHPDDDFPLSFIKGLKCPSILVINKIDMLRRKQELLPFIESCRNKFAFTDFVPVSARSGENVAHLEEVIGAKLPEGELYFPEEQLTDKGQRFMIAELVREQLFRLLGQELPYSIAVDVEKFSVTPKITDINVNIWVEKSGQKAIVIGAKGEMLKKIGERSRLQMERIFDNKINLQLWVKIRKGWADNALALKGLGYQDEN
ncbi:GTPase Era [Pseudomonadota bacterium]